MAKHSRSRSVSRGRSGKRVRMSSASTVRKSRSRSRSLWSGRSASTRSSFAGSAVSAIASSVAKGVERGEKKANAQSSLIAGKTSYTNYAMKGGKSIPKILKFVTTTQTIMDEHGFYVTGTLGAAGYAFTSSMHQLDMSRLWNVETYQRYLQSGASAPSGSVIDNKFNNVNCVLQSGSCEYRLINGSIFPAHIEMYDMVCIKDCDSSPEQMMANDVDDLNSNRVTGLSNDIALSANFTGLHPGDSPSIKQYWRVVKHNTICLAPGETHYHKTKYYWNKLLPSSINTEFTTFNSAASNNQFVRGYSNGVLFRVTGFPVGQGDGTLSKIALSASEIGCVVLKRFKFRPILLPGKHMEVISSISAPTAPTVLDELTGLAYKATTSAIGSAITNLAVAAIG